MLDRNIGNEPMKAAAWELARANKSNAMPTDRHLIMQTQHSAQWVASLSRLVLLSLRGITTHTHRPQAVHLF